MMQLINNVSIIFSKTMIRNPSLELSHRVQFWSLLGLLEYNILKISTLCKLHLMVQSYSERLYRLEDVPKHSHIYPNVQK